jgi:hypothetical protein
MIIANIPSLKEISSSFSPPSREQRNRIYIRHRVGHSRENPRHPREKILNYTLFFRPFKWRRRWVLKVAVAQRRKGYSSCSGHLLILSRPEPQASVPQGQIVIHNSFLAESPDAKTVSDWSLPLLSNSGCLGGGIFGSPVQISQIRHSGHGKSIMPVLGELTNREQSHKR